jgi:Cu2+-exporting ATPase
LYDEVKDKAIGMMTLIGVAITVAWAYSVAITFGLQGMDFYWEMATLIDIMLIGHYFEMKSVMGASRSLELLVKMMPSTAHHLKDGHIHDMPVSELKIGDMVMVKPGEKVPVDGIVIEGESYVDESMLTGESKPVKKEKDSKVIGGAVNSNGSLTIKVTSTGKDSYLNKVVKLVEDAQKSKIQNTKFCRPCRKGFDVCCFRWWCNTLSCLAAIRFSICICFGKNGNSNGYFLPSCFRFGCAFSCSYFNFNFCTKRFTHSQQNSF